MHGDRLPVEPADPSELAVRGVTLVDRSARGYDTPACESALADIAATGANCTAIVVTGRPWPTCAELRASRVMHDPVANFTEHQMLVGLSFFLGNAPR